MPISSCRARWCGPRTSRSSRRRRAGVPVRSEIDLAAERARVPIVAVTGTNGKTTVTSMIAAMLDASGRARGRGREHRPAADRGGRRRRRRRSSPKCRRSNSQFAETFRPRVAVAARDHARPSRLARSFRRLRGGEGAHHRTSDRATISSSSTPTTRSPPAWPRTRPRVASGSRRAPTPTGASASSATRWCIPTDANSRRSPSMRRALIHDRTNALTSAAAALEVGATADGVRDTLRDYATMPHRVALVGEAIWGDSGTTIRRRRTPTRPLRAVSSFDSVVLLAGGRNKGLDLSVLGTLAPRLRGVVAFGEAGPEVAAAFAGPATPVVKADRHARRGARRARPRAARATSCCCRPPARRSTRTRDTPQRGDDFAAEVRARDPRGGGSPMTALSPRALAAPSQLRQSVRAVQRGVAEARRGAASSCRARRSTSCCARPSACSTSSGS